MEVSTGVRYHKNTGVNWRIRMWAVEYLEVDFHATSTLILTQISSLGMNSCVTSLPSLLRYKNLLLVQPMCVVITCHFDSAAAQP